MVDCYILFQFFFFTFSFLYYLIERLNKDINTKKRKNVYLNSLFFDIHEDYKFLAQVS